MSKKSASAEFSEINQVEFLWVADLAVAIASAFRVCNVPAQVEREGNKIDITCQTACVRLRVLGVADNPKFHVAGTPFVEGGKLLPQGVVHPDGIGFK